MTVVKNLYRRPSGIYVVRLTTPERFRSCFQQREIHVSTATTDSKTAKLTAMKITAVWLEQLAELDDMDYEKIGAGSPLLKGAGLIRLQNFCKMFSVETTDALQEIFNYNIPIYCSAENWQAYYVDDYRTIDREDISGFVLDDALAKGIATRHSGFLAPLQTKHTLSQLIAHGKSVEETVFRVTNAGFSCFFLDLPGVDLTAEDIYINKLQAEGLRARWAKIFTTTISPPSSRSPAPPPVAAVALTSSATKTAAISEFCNPTHAELTVSSRIEDFINFKGARWTEETAIRTRSTLGLFVETMNDPAIGIINRDYVRLYIQKLRQIPHHRDIAKKKFGTTDINQIIELTDSATETMSEQSVSKHIEKLSQYFSWLNNEGILKQNPAKDILVRPKKKIREQDKRKIFSSAELQSIFSANWFKTGTDKKNSHNRFSYYRPYQYWLPLLAIYTGGRINELSQLYLKDIKKSENSETYYIDFNLDGAGKTDDDASDASVFASDKSLKTTNSERIVPIHSFLISLGFLEYVAALEKNHYERLFPELKRDRIKGYGKPATSFFNERYFGSKLGIARDGKKTFHSFRHMFITKLWELDIPEHIIAQLVGHARGSTESSKHYRKDSEANRLVPYISSLEWELPEISPFKVDDALIAIRSALLRKTSNDRKNS